MEEAPFPDSVGSEEGRSQGPCGEMEESRKLGPIETEGGMQRGRLPGGNRYRNPRGVDPRPRRWQAQEEGSEEGGGGP